MRKVILTMQMTLDGVVSDVEQWMTMPDEVIEDTLAYYETLDTIVVGGKSYPGLAEYWQMAEETSESALERRFAKRINDIQKVVFSRSKMDLTWKNSQQILVDDSDSLVREIQKLKAGAGEDISVESGAKSWQLFIQNALFDDIWVFIHPVVAAQGDKLFADVATKFSLELRDSKRYPNGIVGLYYQKRQ